MWIGVCNHIKSAFLEMKPFRGGFAIFQLKA